MEMKSMQAIEGCTANEAWCNARALFQAPDVGEWVEGRGGRTREVLHVVCNIRHPLQRWTIARAPAINPAFAIAELIWILNGRDDSAFLNRWNSKLPSFAGEGAKYDGAYGARLRNRFGVDQIRRVCDALSSNPGSRQAVLQIWDAASDLPLPDGLPASPDVPCNVCSLLKIRGGKLEWSQVLRSNDLFLGLPYNFIQFTFLQEILAGCLQVGVGNYCHFSDSLHVYERDIERFGKVELATPAVNTDQLNAPLELSDQYFRELANAAEFFGDTSSNEYCQIASDIQVPEPYRNLALIMAAESSRRRRMVDEIENCLLACTNPALTQIYRFWLHSRPT
jgi:thymidylate synthase